MIGYNEYQNIIPLPRRRAYFVFGDDTEMVDKFVLEGLNVKFDIQYFVGGMFPRAHFAICNLNGEHLQYLTSLFSFGNPMRRNRTIKFFAGYDDAKPPGALANITLLYKGVVMLTSITPPPDIWFNIEALACGNIRGSRVQFFLKGAKTIREIAAMAASYYGLELEWRAMNPGAKIIQDFACDGDGFALADKLSRADLDIQFCSDSLRLRVTDTKAPVDNPAVPHWLIDRDHAMIGVPRFSYNGATVDTLLNPLARAGDCAILKSKFQTLGNSALVGSYFIRQLRHHGELRGNDFNTTFDLFRPKV